MFDSAEVACSHVCAITVRIREDQSQECFIVAVLVIKALLLRPDVLMRLFDRVIFVQKDGSPVKTNDFLQAMVDASVSMTGATFLR